MKQPGRYARFGMRIALFVLLALLIPGCFAFEITAGTVPVAVVLALGTGGCIFVLLCPFTQGQKTAYLLVIALFMRLLWNWNVTPFPADDYQTIYDAAGALLLGDVTAFWGTHYLARFPHLTIPALYMAAMRFFLGTHALSAMCAVNILASVMSVYLTGRISGKLFQSPRAEHMALAIAAVFPPMVIYTATFCSETLAMPFYLAAVSLFLDLPVRTRKKALLCGFLLAVGNLFRGVAVVVLVACLLFLLLFDARKLRHRIADGCRIALCYLAVMWLVSSVLQWCGITQYPLWHGAEPNSASVLKGVNMASGGRWNEEDAAFIAENLHHDGKLDALCRREIRARLHVPVGEGIAFYGKKMADQWRMGDFSGAYWSQHGAIAVRFPLPQPVCPAFQVFYAVLLLLSAAGLFRRTFPNGMNICLLLLCGYGTLYLITEMQPRYGYIVCWLFVFFAINGIYTVANGAKLLYNKTIMRKR